MIELNTSAGVERRKADILVYNQANRWRKRGLSVVPLKFGLDWNNSPFTVLVSVYATDGTVAITHGGVEVGQGIDTKVAQVAARTLGVPLDMIVIKPSNNLTNPNGASTGGSTTSELACLIAIVVVNAILLIRVIRSPGHPGKSGYSSFPEPPGTVSSPAQPVGSSDQPYSPPEY